MVIFPENPSCIQRLSIIVKRPDGSFVEIFADDDESVRVWERVWNEIALHFGRWAEQKIEIEKNT